MPWRLEFLVLHNYQGDAKMGLKVTHREQDGISILQLKGRLTLGPEDEVLNDEIQHALTVRRVRVVIDLSGLNKMDSAGLGSLLAARAELTQAGGGLALVNLKSAYMKALAVARLETVFQVFGSEQDAINSFFPERRIPHYDLLAVVASMRPAAHAM
jgi:anti-sigma B factor antagonist